ncbi:MAG: hypothetical protein J5854_04615 [Clostridia bacterium]|nr:hypothetical protein [Clostridia bacterium]
MKKFLAILLVIVFVTALTGCSKLIKILDVLNETEAPAEDVTPEPAATAAAPTDAPEVTLAPSEEPTGDPNETEAPPADPSFVRILEPGVALGADLDGDGLEDSVMITREAISEWGDYEYVLKILLGADPENTYVYVVEYCYECSACVLDCYPDDGRMEVLISYVHSSNDWTTVAFRVINDGGLIDDFTEYFGVTEEAMRAFTTEDGFEITEQTDVFGTRMLHARMKITYRGFFMVSQDYTYVWDYDADPDTDEYWDITLIAPLEVEIVNDEGIVQGAYTVPVGTRIIPVQTNLDDYVIIKLPDGRLGRVQLEIRSWEVYGDNFGIFINGRKQDEYAKMFYAD